ncbi:MAG: FAD:protein FMN transferase [Gammaproteobacteria bacterium]|nr:FAD:protein FMN transferase [Gammaproteobacteria bacterium]
MNSLARCLLAGLAICGLLARPSQAEWIGEAQAHMGTEVSVYLWHDDPERGREAAAAIFAEMARLDNHMSTYKDDSRISEINRNAATAPVVAGDELFSLIQRALDISLLTKGAFDITYDSVGRHYDFREHRRPDAATIAGELPLIDYRFVNMNSIDGTIGFAREGVRINLGGIAKGYAVEQGVAIARRYGVRNARVTAGGDTRLLGDRRGTPWMVGVQNPRDDSKVAVTIPLKDEAISTSGDYERYFDEGGERFHHIIRPSTGLPAGEVHSVTIIGPDAVITDALSTSVFIMGVDEGLRLIATLPDYEGIVIDASGEMYYSDGLKPPE